MWEKRQHEEAQYSCCFPPGAIHGVRQDELKDLLLAEARGHSRMEEGRGHVSLLTELCKGMLATSDPAFLSLWERGNDGRTNTKKDL